MIKKLFLAVIIVIMAAALFADTMTTQTAELETSATALPDHGESVPDDVTSVAATAAQLPALSVKPVETPAMPAAAGLPKTDEAMPPVKTDRPARPQYLKDPYFTASFLIDFSGFKQGEIDAETGHVLCEEFDPVAKPIKQGVTTFAILTSLFADAILVSHENELPFGTNPYNEEIYTGLNDKQKALLKSFWISYKEYPQDIAAAMKKTREKLGDIIFMPLETVQFLLYIDSKPGRYAMMSAYDVFEQRLGNYKKTYYGCEPVGKNAERALDYARYVIDNASTGK
ncbi:MAG: hypothetical protein LLG37_05245 [Spirochaetia bacterium]|nr:hypothetical protein [Spirochaetia bacterium]